MKYANYIINGHPVRCEELGVIAIPAVVFAIPALIGFLGGAIIMDSGRYLKLKYLLFNRDQRRLNYIKGVIRSLDHRESRELINLLTAA